jgi:hypothetical protein
VVAAQLSQNRTREIWIAGHTSAPPWRSGKEGSDLDEGKPGLREASQRWVNMDDIASSAPKLRRTSVLLPCSSG